MYDQEISASVTKRRTLESLVRLVEASLGVNQISRSGSVQSIVHVLSVPELSTLQVLVPCLMLCSLEIWHINSCSSMHIMISYPSLYTIQLYKNPIHYTEVNSINRNSHSTVQYGRD